jgi:DNA repair protein RadA/Sms
MRISEPAADLAVCLAVVSSLTDRPIREKVAVFGEVGLAGEVRRATHASLRVREAARLGFTRVILPPDSLPKADVPAGVTLVPVASVGELLDALFE